MSFSNEAPQQFLIISQNSNPNLYLCYCHLYHHQYSKKWLNGYDILGIQERSNYLFSLKQAKQCKHYVTKHDPDREINIIPLTDARVAAGKQIQHDMK